MQSVEGTICASYVVITLTQLIEKHTNNMIAWVFCLLINITNMIKGWEYAAL